MSNEQNNNSSQERVFVIGSTRIAENDSTRGKSVEDVKRVLQLQYPEIGNATVKEVDNGDVVVVSFTPRAGRKG